MSLKFEVFYNRFFVDACAAYEVARRPYYVFVLIHLVANQEKNLQICDDDLLFSFLITEAILYLGGIDITI